MCRYGTKVTDGSLYVETDDGWIEVGPEETLLELLGETYTIEYDERERPTPWLDTDGDGVLSIYVSETLSELTFTEAFVEQIDACGSPDEGGDEVPVRSSQFHTARRFLSVC